MRLVWKAGEGIAECGAVRVALTAAPVLPFAYQGLWYDDDRDHATHLRDSGGQEEMSAAEVAAVRAYLQGL